MPLPDTLRAAFERRFGAGFQTGAAIRAQHAATTTWLAPEAPDGVIHAACLEDVQDAVRFCAAEGVAVIPHGAGSSLEGHLNAPRGGISLDLTRMDRVLAVHDTDMDAVVQPGVTRSALNADLRDTGLFFPLDPGADATLGGMAATRASGTTTVRYGTMRDNVLSLKAVMADGSVMTTGGRARKSAAGFDLTRLLIGSEGTLGIITELTLKLQAIPARVIATAAPFSSVAGACEAAIEAGASGLALQRIELLDAVMIRAVNAHAKLGLAETPHLFVEIAGGEASTQETLAAFQEIALGNGALCFDWAEERHAKRRLWQARHDAYPAVGTTWPGRATVVSDVAVPLSALAQCVTETVADIAASGLTAPIVGHVGDGNFHAIPVFDAADASEAAAVRAFLDRLVRRALALGGTCTGEHGIGQGKARYLAEELGGPAVAAMRAIKSALDPHGLLNPGKILAGPSR